MNRRSFLKLLVAASGASMVPALGKMLPLVPEPLWRVEEMDFGFQLGVAGQWNVGGKIIRHAVVMPFPEWRWGKQRAVEYAKQALRQWYLERHALRKAA